jgi:DNA-binding transcriptional ArsR family regulator
LSMNKQAKNIVLPEVTTQDLCPNCFKVVGVSSRYKIVCILAQHQKGLTVSELTIELGLTQPTVTHHLNILRSVDAVRYQDRGRERVYFIRPEAHCFEECKIPYEYIK